MKQTLLYALILVFACLKGGDHSFSASRHRVISNYTDQYNKFTISGANDNQAPIDLLTAPVFCNDDEDEFEFVKKKSFFAIPFSAIEYAFEKIVMHNELTRSQRFSKYSNRGSQPVYILQKRLLI